MRSPLADLLSSLPDEAVKDLHAFWCPEGEEGRGPLLGAMTNAGSVATRWNDLGRKLVQLMGHFLREPGYTNSTSALKRSRSFAFLTPYEIEAALAALARRGFLFPVDSAPWGDAGTDAFAVPEELGVMLTDLLRRENAGVAACLDIQSYLKTRDIASNGTSEAAVRLLGRPTAVLSRLETTTHPLDDLVHRTASDFGGILTRAMFDPLHMESPVWEDSAWRADLEDKYLGAVSDLALERFGIRCNEEALVLFRETMEAISGTEPPVPEPQSVAEVGIDLLSNVSRFLTYHQEHSVRFTAKGSIFRTTAQRIASKLLPVADGEIADLEVLDLIRRFSLSTRLIARTAERTYRVGPEAVGWDNLDVEEKARRFLQAIVEDQDLPGEYFHQIRLRRLLLGELAALEDGEWVPVMRPMFAARNRYLARLEESEAGDFFASRFRYAHYIPLETPQQMAWNLLDWVRRRLHPLGLVDLGYDGAGRPCALRLSTLGARVLQGQGAQVDIAGHLVVNPDFEVVLFPAGDDLDLTHALDRFCERTKTDVLLHYLVTEESVLRGMAEGMSLDHMLATLSGHSRVAVPQNVLFSLESWCEPRGRLRIGGGGHLSCDHAETLDRVMGQPPLRELIEERTGPVTVRIKKDIPAARLRSRLCKAGFTVEKNGG